MQIAVIIPTLNEAECIGDLVKEVSMQPVAQVIVVDNNSTDGTGEIARRAGARVVSEPRRGYGYACAAGVTASEGADVLVFIDGDYSFLPSEMPTLLQPLREGRADLVLGSREQGHIAPGSMPFQQRFGNALIAYLMRALYGLQVTDLGPYRAIRRDLLLSLNLSEMTFGWLAEMLLQAARQHAHIVQVPVSYHSRRAGKSKVSGTLRGTILAGYHLLRVTFSHRR